MIMACWLGEIQALKSIILRRRIYRKKNFVCISVVCLTLLVLVKIKLNTADNHRFLLGRMANESHFKTVFRENRILKTKGLTKILLWTKYFGGTTWYDESKNVFTTTCNKSCVLTDDKSQIASADAVIFHLFDISWNRLFTSPFQAPFPKCRHQDQLWILHNLEPLTNFFGTIEAWQWVFNMTWSYTRSSDIYTPFGMYRKLEISEIKHATEDYSNYFNAKPESGGIAMISNCYDDARRYKIIAKMSEYIPVRIIGHCGESCPSDYNSCNSVYTSYKFYFALENSDCIDYVTEKYWRAIVNNQVPIVAWRYPMDGLVIPGSYVNVFDFPNLDEAGQFIQELNRNETLYNSFFKWKKTFKMFFDENAWCKVCDVIQKENLPRAVYHDFAGWLSNNNCPQLTVTNILSRVLDRLLFKIGF